MPLCLRGFSFTPNTRSKAVSFSDLELEEGTGHLQMDSLGDISRNEGAFIIGDNEIDNEADEVNPFQDLNALHVISSQETICANEVDLGEMNTSAHFMERQVLESVDVVDSIPADWVRFDDVDRDQTYAPITLANPFENIANK
jgi:hypothetical protein